MKLKLDAFTWIVIAVVLVLLVAAVVTVNRSLEQETGEVDYVTADAPDTPVRNAFLAFQNGDLFRAREQYSRRALDQLEDNQGVGPFSAGYYRDDRTARRLRIVETTMDPENPDRALVTFVEDSYNSGGLFGGGNTWSSRRTVEVVREADGWKIDSPEIFY